MRWCNIWFGTGKGFTADLITTGKLEAQRVITNELMSYMNEQLNLTQNKQIISTVGQAIGDISIGGQNLLYGTSSKPAEITETTSLGIVDLSGYGEDWDRKMTFRVKVNVVKSGTWHVLLKMSAPQEGAFILDTSQLDVDELYQRSIEYTDVISESVSQGDSTYITITSVIKEGCTCVEPIIVLEPNDGIDNEGASLFYKNAKLELGNIATDYQVQQDDIANSISSAQSQIIQLEKSITSIVTEEDVNEKVQSAIQQQANKIEVAINNQLSDINTHIVIDDNGLTLRSQENAETCANLTSGELNFIRTNDNVVVAKFGKQSCTIDNLEAKSKLSVGSNEYGWYDYIAYSKGVTDKWRNVQSSFQPCVIIHQPVNYIVDQPSTSLSFAVVAENAQGYQWEKKRKGENDSWEQIDNAISDQYSEDIQSNDSDYYNFEYHCVVKGEQGFKVVSRSVCANNRMTPCFLEEPPEEQEVDWNNPSVTLYICAYSPNYSTLNYKWQRKNAGQEQAQWEDVPDGTTNTLTIGIGNDTIFRCVVLSENNSVLALQNEYSVVYIQKPGV